MVLDKANLISYDAKAVAYCVLEIFAKIPMGLVIVGMCEANEGESTFAASFSSLLGITNAETSRREGREAKQMADQLQAVALEMQRAGMPVSLPTQLPRTVKQPISPPTAANSMAESEYTAANPSLLALQLRMLLQQQQEQAQAQAQMAQNAQNNGRMA